MRTAATTGPKSVWTVACRGSRAAVCRFCGRTQGPWATMAPVAGTSGKHAGARKAPKPQKSSRFPVAALGYAFALTACVVAWGYLVWLAIDFGTTARAGNASAWWLLGLATLGAMACLFVGLLLAARLGHVVGLASPATVPPPQLAVPSQPSSSPSTASPSAVSHAVSQPSAGSGVPTPTSPRVRGGRRALR